MVNAFWTACIRSNIYAMHVSASMNMFKNNNKKIKRQNYKFGYTINFKWNKWVFHFKLMVGYNQFYSSIYL